MNEDYRNLRAPVFSPLWERIRELEADYTALDEARRAIEGLWTEQRLRAEKAEAEWHGWERRFDVRTEECRKLQAEVERLKAHVRTYHPNSCTSLIPCPFEGGGRESGDDECHCAGLERVSDCPVHGHWEAIPPANPAALLPWPEGKCINHDHEQVGEHVQDESCGFGNDASWRVWKYEPAPAKARKEDGERDRYEAECLICGTKWQGTDEGILRAAVSPCGHQGLFNVARLAMSQASIPRPPVNLK